MSIIWDGNLILGRLYHFLRKAGFLNLALLNYVMNLWLAAIAIMN